MWTMHVYSCIHLLLTEFAEAQIAWLETVIQLKNKQIYDAEYLRNPVL